MSHANKGGRRYRYYVSVAGEVPSASRPTRVAALELERAIIASIVWLLGDRAGLLALFGERVEGAAATEALFRAAVRLRDALIAMDISNQRGLLMEMGVGVIVHADRVEASIRPQRLAGQLGLPPGSEAEDSVYPLAVPTQLVRRGAQRKLVIAAEPAAASRRDPKLVELIVRAHDARRQLLADAAALDDRRRNDLARLARLSFLAPDIIGAILDGRQPSGLTSKRMIRAAAIPLGWNEQRRLFGFG